MQAVIYLTGFAVILGLIHNVREIVNKYYVDVPDARHVKKV
jgi:hypothetical protein